VLATPRNEFPEFPAALSFLFGLTPAEALAALEQRAALLKDEVARLEGELHSESGPPQRFLPPE
jgi:predicted RNase H-like HicB family nuclease